MGYPMTYNRVIQRNSLAGNYADALSGFPPHAYDALGLSEEVRAKIKLISGDLRRLEHDQRDEHHLARYAEVAGITPEQAGAVLDAFFTDFGYRKDGYGGSWGD